MNGLYGIVMTGLLAFTCCRSDNSSDLDTGDNRDTASESDTNGGTVDTDADTEDTETDSSGNTDPRKRIFGVTITDPWVAESAESDLSNALDGLVGIGGRLPTVRVVFDEGVDQIFLSNENDASAYVVPTGHIGYHARVMGELLDSFYVKDYDVSQYRDRACEYRATLGHLVDIWEIGNEINGEWLGDSLLDKIVAATQVFIADAASFGARCPEFELQPNEKPFELAITLYYNGSDNGGVSSDENCWSEAAHSMGRWADEHFAIPGSAGFTDIAPYLDYVFVSYYEQDCDGIQPAWQSVFDRLGEIFPQAALGFGECGTDVLEEKLLFVERYYHGIDSAKPEFANMKVQHPRFAGGYFWWYFSDDLDDKPVYSAIQSSLSNSFWAQ